MRFEPTGIAGAFVVHSARHPDRRGHFVRLLDTTEFAEHGLAAGFVQINASYTRRAGTVRGLHYQVAPYGEAKLFCCLAGSVFDVMADVRQGSPTFGRWVGVPLCREEPRMLYVPAGVAHGFQALEDGVEVVYPTSAPHAPSAERGVRWDDPFFAIEWPLMSGVLLSEKDRAWPDFEPVAGPLPGSADGAGPSAGGVGMEGVAVAPAQPGRRRADA